METTKTPGFSQAALCFGGIFLLISTGIFWLDINLHLLLITALVWACLHGHRLGHSFQSMRSGMSEGIQKGLGAIYIFIIIGMLVAAFIESGTVAWLIYYGLEYLSPGLFLPVSLILCTLMSLATGTAWGTVATAGVVLLEIGSAMNIPLPLIAGVVISGASCGDKMSPVSDTTNLSAMSAGAPLFRHIKVMAWTSTPAYTLTLLTFTLIGFSYTSEPNLPDSIQMMQSALSSSFSISLLAVLPLVVLVICSARRMAPEIAMLASILTAGFVAIAVQGVDVTQFLNSLQGGYKANTELETLNNLLSRGGIQSMMWTLSLCLIALALGGVLNKLGILTALLKGVISRVQSTGSLIATTISTGFLSNMCLGEAYLSIILGGQLYKKAYEKRELDSAMLSRSLEEGATLTTGLIPWTTSGLFYSATLGVSVLEFAPWALFNLLSPMLAIIMVFLGIGIFKKRRTAQANTQDAEYLSE
ncbi:Na+/H+ antiporter NhaC [Endozoicomonas arenosclerae]|uniref:Na+/H+ antiporter NhaC n=1 Tax=Endozoicomonas arenosclerae TaxID=1633495 RepID=UPI000784F3B3|nr:Na+/H+ antiporter NhaC [Endozoicomonas arenosclerae]